jgi:hypothetical protein
MNEGFNFEETIKELKEQIKEGEIEYENFREVFKQYKELGFHLEKLLEYAIKNAKTDVTKFRKLYDEIKVQNIANLCDELRSYGESLRLKKSEVEDKESLYKRFYDKEKNTPVGMTFRILELSRLEKREEVFYIILREFIAVGEEVSEKLVRAFNPKYSIESFRTLLYSFFSGLLGGKEDKKEDKKSLEEVEANEQK